jgi:predicted nucleotidyltransferase
MRRAEALSILRAHSGELARRFGVRELTLFGSVARDEATPESDVDVLVALDGPASFDRFMDLKFFLEEILSARVDLVTHAGLRSRIRPAIDREAIRVA